MVTTDKFTCRQLATLLQAYGVKKAVLSPGTRDTPIIMALNRAENISCNVVIDERSAAFTAPGMATVANEPVAVVCTSGTAPLNFAPAEGLMLFPVFPVYVTNAVLKKTTLSNRKSSRTPKAEANPPSSSVFL